jgi:Protein of unknown function (DUF3515)
VRARRPALIASALALPLTVVLALVLAGGHHDDSVVATVTDQPSTPLSAIRESAPPDNPATAAACTQLLTVLPDELQYAQGEFAQARPVVSSSPYVRAWGEPAIVLRCGVPRPADVVPASTKVWFPFPGNDPTAVYWDPVDTKQGSVWTTTDRAVYIEADFPQAYSTPPLQELSVAIMKVLPSVCVVGSSDPAKGCTYRS